MKSKSAFLKFTKRELDILNILWESKEPLTTSQITQVCPELTINTVQATLRKLLKNGFIEVADIVHSGTVLCRRYRPTESQSSFVTTQFKEELQYLNTSIPKTSLVASLFEKEDDPEKALKEIAELEDMLKQYKEKLQKEE